METTLIQAKVADCTALTHLTKLSKAHWGYSPEQMAKWETNLTITPAFFAEHHLFKLLIEEEIVAYYAIKKMPDQQLRLECLFVLPAYIGHGFGQQLIQNCMEQAKKQDCTHIILDADPNAVGFYQKYGFKQIDQIPTAIPNRYLPVMQCLVV